jgi:hypothetical protein
MKLVTQEIEKSLSNAYLKQSLKRNQIETFKANLETLLTKINDYESEEHNKNIISDFLKDTYYKGIFDINTSGRADIVINAGKFSTDPVAVIFEAKKPSNTAEMISWRNPNAKALHELLLYYLQERQKNNIYIKHLIITNIYEWYIFDAADFENLFYKNAKLKQLYKDWSKNGLIKNTTDFFYAEVAKPFIENEIAELTATYFDIRNYREIIENGDIADDDKLINLYKVLSPENLLKKEFVNDSNSLNKEFYSELLHIIGLEEQADKGKKIIARKKPENRDEGSLLENAINIIEVKGKLREIENIEQFGASREEQIYSVALELCITWLNRILFLKLLEGQLVKYHNGNQDYKFINSTKISDFDELDELFFEVLAIKVAERSQSVNEKFGFVPYLNSSLFEISHLENKAVQISNLKGRLKMPIYSSTVLKMSDGRKITGTRNTLLYLFDFLDSFDFASESSAKIQEENKSIINASVLGLIFEKINGYKDGSFFTPGFITMYMCRETIRRAVAQKFKERENAEIENYDDVKAFCARHFKVDDILRFNSHIDSLKICDPAVGSGHFLVSALNEIIAIKSDLDILADAGGITLEYSVTVENDELTTIHKSKNTPFEYKMGEDGKPPQALEKVQMTLFREKQKIIENCLFGVDINPKSVLICRLRLWIELLKNAYYKNNTVETRFIASQQPDLQTRFIASQQPDLQTRFIASQQPTVQTRLIASLQSELETLPNIDINIKCGNSLISRYPLDVDIKAALKTVNLRVEDYRMAVMLYRNAQSKELKRLQVEMIEKLKGGFVSVVAANDKRQGKLKHLQDELWSLQNQTFMFPQTNAEKAKWERELKTKAGEIQKLDAELEEVNSNKIYDNAFEWRFEFPEVLDDDGNFVGFDVVIGNPPYGVSLSITEKDYFLNNFYSAISKPKMKGSLDTYSLFIDRGFNILKINSILSFIVPLSITSSESMAALHNLLINNCEEISISTYSNRPKKIFDNADQRVSIITFNKTRTKAQKILTTKVNKRYDDTPAQDTIDELQFVNSIDFVRYGRIPKIGKEIERKILQKLFSSDTYLKDLTNSEGLPVYYRSAGGRYYNIVTNFPTNSSQEKPIFVKGEYQNIIAALLSTNLYFWFLHIFSDNLHIKSYELEIFPIPVNNFSDEKINEIEELYKLYLIDLEKNSIIQKVNYTNISEMRVYYARKSKHLIDQIDLAIKDAYGLTDDEINFIINYDLKFRTDGEE